MKAKKTAKSKKIPIAAVIAATVELATAHKGGIEKLPVDYGREDLNQLAHKINEIIDTL